MSNDQWMERMQQEMSNLREEDGSPTVNHAEMDFPEDMKDLEYSLAIVQAERMDSPHDKWKHWKKYRYRLKNKLMERQERLKEAPWHIRIQEVNYQWDILLRRLDLLIEKYGKKAELDNMMGIGKRNQYNPTPPENEFMEERKKAAEKNKTPRELSVKIAARLLEKEAGSITQHFSRTKDGYRALASLYNEVIKKNKHLKEHKNNIPYWLGKAFENGRFDAL